MNEWNASRCDAMRDETRRWVQRPAFVRIHRAFVRVVRVVRDDANARVAR